jgi:hypothetical protein
MRDDARSSHNITGFQLSIISAGWQEILVVLRKYRGELAKYLMTVYRLPDAGDKLELNQIRVTFEERRETTMLVLAGI